MRLARIAEGNDFPALSKQIIDAVSALDDDASSLQRLANVVLREYSLTLGVVRTANSAHYRRSGRPIQSATHAMMMLGARTVRQLASSLLLFENYHKGSPALRELMLMSLLTANHAREVATKLGIAEPEEAHLCGMFRNLGEVLVACHFPEDHASIQALIVNDRKTDVGAATAVLGFRFEELGVEVSRQWGMPDTVTQGITAKASASVSLSAAITAFSHDLTLVLYHRDQDDSRRTAALDDVLARHAGKVKLTREQVQAVVAGALNETRELFTSAQIATDRFRLKQLTQSAKLALGVAALPCGEWDATDDPRDDGDGALTLRDALRDTLRQELQGKATNTADSELGDVLLLALEGALRGGPFDRVIACVLNADRTQLTARSGLGVGVEELMAQFSFPMSIRGGPVVAALLQRQPVYVPADRGMNAMELRWAQTNGAKQFGVFPIVVAGKIVGCLYVDRVTVGDVPDRATLRYVKTLSDLVVQAIAVRRRAASTPASTPALPVAETAVLSSVNATGGAPASPPPPESQAESVLRLLQGASADVIAADAGVPVETLLQWKEVFLAGALARLKGS